MVIGKIFWRKNPYIIYIYTMPWKKVLDKGKIYVYNMYS